MSLSLFSLEGKVALVTGSGQGIGLAIAEGLSEAGAHVVLNGRDKAKLEAARKAIGDGRPQGLDRGLRRHRPGGGRGRRRARSRPRPGRSTS